MVRIIDSSTLTREVLERMGQNDKDMIYNGLDCCLTLEIDEETDGVMDDVARAVYARSLALQAPILEMNMRGILVDPKAKNDALRSLDKDAVHMNKLLEKLVQGVFNFELNANSPKQVAYLLYDRMQLPVKKKRNAKGEYVITTDRDTLEQLAQMYYICRPFITLILGIRDVEKQISTIATPLANGRFMTSLGIAGTKTGRLASSIGDFAVGKNLQNIDRRIKKMFIADPGYKLINVDLEQADARNVGAMTWNLFPEFGDSGRFLDFAESGDLHTAVCRMCWSELPWTDNPKENRAIADQRAYREKSYRDLAKILGHGCLTADHEVLTPNGWVPIASNPDRILQWDNNQSSWADVSHWENHQYTGTLQSFENHNISALMTHDHRVPYKKDPLASIVYEQPAEAGPGKFMPMGGNYTGGSISVPARLIAAFQADGHQEVNWMAFHLVKERKKLRLLQLCNQYGYEFVIHGDKIRVRGELPKYPGAYMLDWTKACIEEFVNELRYWDGTIGPTAISISSVNKQALEWYQTLGRLVGVGGNISKPYTSGFGSTVYRLQQNNRSWMTGASVVHKKIPVENVTVHCPTVPTGWFYVRRNGKIFVTGNTNFNGQPHTMAMHTKVAQHFIQDFQNRYFGAFPEVRKRIEWVDQQIHEKGYLTTLFGRRRFFLGRANEKSTLNAACAFDPQSMTADEINNVMIRIYTIVKKRFPELQMLIQVHDSLLMQYPEHLEEEIIPWIKEAFRVAITIRGNRTFIVPSEVQVGWNWDYRIDWSEKDFAKGKCTREQVGTCKENPDGMIKYKGRDNRSREYRFDAAA